MHLLTEITVDTGQIIDVLFAGTPGECMEAARATFRESAKSYAKASFNVTVEPQTAEDDPLWATIEWIVGGKTRRFVVRYVPSLLPQSEVYASSEA